MLHLVDKQIEMQWQGVRFVLKKPTPNSAVSHLDLLLADRVVRDCIQVHAAGIRCWRIHRRFGDSSPNGGDHIFSFYLYSSRDTFTQIRQHIEQSAIAKSLVETGQLLRVIFEEEDTDPLRSRSLFGFTSASEWSQEVQESWPYFAMGLSQELLAMIQSCRTKLGESSELSMPDSISNYAAIENRIDEIWFNEGQAFVLHQSSAMFGYSPTLITMPLQF